MRGLHSWVTGEGASGIWLRCLAGICLTFGLSSVVFPKEQSERDAHIQLIRGLLREVAVSKVPLPRGKKGVRVDPQGKLDKADADSQPQFTWHGNQARHASGNQQAHVQVQRDRA